MDGTASAGTNAAKFAQEGHVHPTDTSRESVANKNVAGGYAGLDPEGKLFMNQMPQAITQSMTYAGTFNASTAAATLSVNAQTILGTSSSAITLTNNTAAITGYTVNNGNIYRVTTAGTFAGISLAVGDFLLATASGWVSQDNTDVITGVKGNAESSYRTGNVNITPANIGLGSVNNTSDANKPISAAQQTALDAKASQSDMDGLKTEVEALGTVYVINYGDSTGTQSDSDLILEITNVI